MKNKKQNQSFGSITVVLVDRINGKDMGTKKHITTYNGNGDWLGKTIDRHITKGVAKARQSEVLDRFWGEGKFAPSVV